MVTAFSCIGSRNKRNTVSAEKMKHKNTCQNSDNSYKSAGGDCVCRNCFGGACCSASGSAHNDGALRRAVFRCLRGFDIHPVVYDFKIGAEISCFKDSRNHGGNSVFHLRNGKYADCEAELSYLFLRKADSGAQDNFRRGYSCRQRPELFRS